LVAALRGTRFKRLRIACEYLLVDLVTDTNNPELSKHYKSKD